MKLLVITPEQTRAGETDIANELLAGGLHRLHIRKPGFSVDDYRGYIGQIGKEHYGRLCIHGSFKLYHELGLGGVHLSSYARSEPTVWAAIGGIKPAAVSTSFHSWEEVRDSTFAYAYVFVSPVFDSISKVGYGASIDFDGAVAVKRELADAGKYCPEIIGLGGVGAAQVRVLVQHQFDGAALLGSVWLSEDPLGAFNKIREAVAGR